MCLTLDNKVAVRVITHTEEFDFLSPFFFRLEQDVSAINSNGKHWRSRDALFAHFSSTSNGISFSITPYLIF